MKKINPKIIWKKSIHWISRIGSDADNDWRIILGVSIIVFFAIIVGNLQIFLSVENQKRAGVSLQAKKTEFIDVRALSQVVSEYNLRVRDYARIASTTVNLVDPAK